MELSNMMVGTGLSHNSPKLLNRGDEPVCQELILSVNRDDILTETDV